MAGKRTTTVSLRKLLIFFIITGILIFLAIGLNLLLKVQQITETVNAKRQADAQHEISIAVNKLKHEAETLGKKFSAWEEVHQQLISPTYYAYWRDQRPHATSKLPDYVIDIELYHANGNALMESSSSTLPNPLPINHSYFGRSNGITYLYQFTPVHDRITMDNIIGYTGIKIDVMQALHHIHHFSFAQSDSIRIKPFSGKIFTLDELLKYITFATPDSPQSDKLESLLKWNLVHFSILMVLLLVFIYIIFKYLISRPLYALIKQINVLRRGEPFTIADEDFSSISVLEIQTLQDSLLRYQEELDRVHDKLDSQNIELWKMAHHDPLTGVYNRRAFDEDWKNIIELFINQRLSVSYLLFDCDHFKAINDTYGHQTGDELIRIVAGLLKNTLRKGDKLYRLGGDEFVAIILNSPPDSIFRIAQRCMQMINNYPFTNLGINEPVAISIGIAFADGTDIDALKSVPRHADLAMYHAKKSSQKIQCYSENMGSEASILSSSIVNAVMRAVNNGNNIHLHYQKILRADNRQICFYEALLRLQNRDKLIYPNEIFPVVHRHSLEADLDRSIIKTVVHDLEKQIIPDNAGVSINLSAATLILPELDKRLCGLLPFLQNRQIILEVTETSLISHLKLATANLQKLQQLGFLIALDDFGSGYSSIRYLANMPVDIVKFDIEMINAMRKDARSRQIIEHVASLILDADYQLVAEGIEDQQTLELVVNMGATHLQGYYLGKPCDLTPADTSRIQRVVNTKGTH